MKIISSGLSKKGNKLLASLIACVSYSSEILYEDSKDSLKEYNDFLPNYIKAYNDMYKYIVKLENDKKELLKSLDTAIEDIKNQPDFVELYNKIRR